MDKSEESAAAALEEPLNPDNPATPKMSPEEERLAGRPPLKTVAVLSVGPIISQVSNAVFAVINTLWTSKACGDDGLAAISTYGAFDNSGRGFGFMLSIGAATQISALFGLGRSEEASQVCADLLRLSLVFGAFLPAVLLPSIRPCGEWFGASKRVVDLGWDYMLPLCAFATTTCMFLAVIGFLQGEGRTALYGLVNFVCLGLNGLVLDPLFLFGFKMGIRGVSIATVVSEILPTIVVLFFYYRGTFGVKLKFAELCKKFSPRTLTAVKVGLSQLIAQLSVTLPSIVLRKYVGMAVGDEFDDAMAGFNCQMRYGGLVAATMLGITSGYVPAASYAYAAKKYKRYIWLSIHAFWMCVAWGVIIGLLIWSIPRELAKLFSTTERYLDYAEHMTFYSHALAPIQGIRYNCQAMLQAMQMGWRATLTGLLNNFVWIIVFTFALYYTDKKDGSRICWSYSISNVMSIPVSVIALWGPMRNMLKLMKETEGEEEMEDVETEGNKEDGRIKSEIPFKDEVPPQKDVVRSSSEEINPGSKEVSAVPEV